MCEIQVTKAIVVIKNTTSLAKRDIDSLLPCEIEMFTQDELMINITQHELVPKHEVLSIDKKQELLKKYKIKEHQLPKISTDDPIAKYFGMKKGQVAKIVRNSETAGKYVTYRIAF